MKQFITYLQLMRFDKPVGIFLLWWPTAWALWLAAKNHVPGFIILCFLVGTIIMRAAGCVINDLADKDIDGYVERTQNRPMAKKTVSIREAITLLICLLTIALIVALQLPLSCFYWAVIALLNVIIYPFCKRFFPAPQVFLGLAFSMGIPMAYSALQVPYDLNMILLWIINFFWINAYDTQYAMVDKAYDIKIGVQSTAILFGQFDKKIILLLQIIFHSLWLALALINHFSLLFYGAWVISACLILYQQQLIKNREPSFCLQAFKNNNYYGLLMWVGILFS